MEISILFGLMLLNGLFAMSEIAVVTSRKARLQKLADEGDAAAATAIKLNESPTRFLSTIQIGITSIGILSGIVGEAALAKPLAAWLARAGIGEASSGYAATGLVVGIITYASIVLGELVPKRLGQMNPEIIARRVARPMHWLTLLGKPFVKLLSESTELVLRLVGAHANRGPAVTQEEIHAMLEEGSDAGVIEQHEHTMVRNVFRLDDRVIASLMTPRSDIVYLDVDAPLEDNLEKVEKSEHSRFPVCRGGFDEVLGIVSTKQLLGQTIRGEALNFTDRLQPPLFILETVTGLELLENFRKSNVQLALAIDEYGEVQGLVSLQDVLEAITGEFEPEDIEDKWAIQRDDGSWLLDGLIPILEMKDRLSLRSVPEESKGRYNTVSGMIMLLLGRVPTTGDWVVWESWRFEIVDMDGKRIDKVLAARLVEPGNSEAS
jgi:putative hemolysin